MKANFDWNKAIQKLSSEPQPALKQAAVICHCPVCKSDNVGDSSTYANNGIYGPGSASWKTFDCRVCNDCGVLFKPVPGNGT